MGAIIQRHIQQSLNKRTYRLAVNAIHQPINSLKNSLPVNGVLGVKTPPIPDEERKLPRETRVTLALPRSGYCSRLNSYISILESNIPNVCTGSREYLRNTNRLFTCPHVKILQISTPFGWFLGSTASETAFEQSQLAWNIL